MKKLVATVLTVAFLAIATLPSYRADSPSSGNVATVFNDREDPASHIKQ